MKNTANAAAAHVLVLDWCDRTAACECPECYEADQARRAACTHPDTIELLDGVKVCTCCEAVI